MIESSFTVGGWPAFWAAVVIGVVVAAILPSREGDWYRTRWFILWMLWCGLTPIRPWYIDIPLMVIFMAAMEFAWQRWRTPTVSKEVG